MIERRNSGAVDADPAEPANAIDRPFHAAIDQILTLPLSKEEKAEAIRRLLAERGHTRARPGGPQP